MQKQQKPKSAQEKPRTGATERDVARPGDEPRQHGGDVRNPGPAPGKSRDPLAHPGDEEDVTPDVIAGQSQPSSAGHSKAKP